MKVLLLKDVYKLGRAGDTKRVADGYGRNYLIPQGLAVLATQGALKQVENIRHRAAAQRTVLNQEMSGVAEKLKDMVIVFPARASETGKLYGSITTQMIAEAISKRIGVEINRRQIDTEPIRTLGEHKMRIRLTVDLVPHVTVLVFREGEAAPVAADEQTEVVSPAAEAQPVPVPEEQVPAEATVEAGEAPKAAE